MMPKMMMKFPNYRTIVTVVAIAVVAILLRESNSVPYRELHVGLFRVVTEQELFGSAYHGYVKGEDIIKSQVYDDVVRALKIPSDE
jgi:hypothetical protein